jgi:hypothetical protein
MRVRSDAGRLLDRVLDIEFDLDKLQVGWGEVTCEEVSALRILSQERRKWEKEEGDRRREDAEMEARVAQAKMRGR